MANSQIICPACQSGLRLAQQVPAGTQIKCPKCGTTFLPAQVVEEAVVVSAPSPSRADRDVYYDDDDDRSDRRRRSKRKQQGSSGPMVAVTAVALFLLIIGGVGAAVAFVWTKHKKEQEQANATHLMGPPQGAPGFPPGFRPGVPPGQPPAPAERPEVQVGHPAMEIDAEDIDGKKFKLSDYRGKVVVLDFWGNW